MFGLTANFVEPIRFLSRKGNGRVEVISCCEAVKPVLKRNEEG